MNIAFYKENISSLQILLAKNKKRHGIVATIRVVVFIAVLILFYFLSQYSHVAPIAFLFLIFIIFFATTGIKLRTILKQEESLERKIAYCNNEISCLNHEYAHYEAGKEFIDNEHPFLADLDIFETGGFFQYINRTVSYLGKHKLAQHFKYPLHESKSIKKRQDAVKELSQNFSFRLEFATTLCKEPYTNEQHNTFLTWLNADSFFTKNKFIQISRFLLPTVCIIAAILSMLSIIPGVLVGILLTLNLGAVYLYLKPINKNHKTLAKQYNNCMQFRSLLLLIENEKFQSELLCKLQNLLGSNNKKASLILKKFTRLVSAFDNRLNILVAFFFNALFLRDFHIMIQLEQWKQENKEALENWFNCIAEIDALQSIANYACNNASYCYPILRNDVSSLDAIALGHPLIPQSSRVCNDYSHAYNSLTIITGANMAGKSTFLRTIGLSILVAGIGAPVCAQKFTTKPLTIRPRIHTKDSLQNNESYFASELRKLKEILDYVQKDEQHFLLFDEILRGTNSKDKLQGSKALVEKLLAMNATGIIATHDVELGDLEKMHPQVMRNMHFDADIINNEINFDYIIKPDICTKMNATFLLKQMGIG